MFALAGNAMKALGACKPHRNEACSSRWFDMSPADLSLPDAGEATTLDGKRDWLVAREGAAADPTRSNLPHLSPGTHSGWPGNVEGRIAVYAPRRKRVISCARKARRSRTKSLSCSMPA